MRTIIEIDDSETLDDIRIETIRGQCQRPHVKDALRRGGSVKLAPGVRALTQRHDSDGLTVRVSRGCTAHVYTEPEYPPAPHVRAQTGDPEVT